MRNLLECFLQRRKILVTSTELPMILSMTLIESVQCLLWPPNPAIKKNLILRPVECSENIRTIMFVGSNADVGTMDTSQAWREDKDSVFHLVRIRPIILWTLLVIIMTLSAAHA